MSAMAGLTWRPERGHRGQQQIADAVTVHASTTPATNTQMPQSSVNLGETPSETVEAVSGRLKSVNFNQKGILA